MFSTYVRPRHATSVTCICVLFLVRAKMAGHALSTGIAQTNLWSGYTTQAQNISGDVLNLEEFDTGRVRLTPTKKNQAIVSCVLAVANDTNRLYVYLHHPIMMKMTTKNAGSEPLPNVQYTTSPGVARFRKQREREEQKVKVYQNLQKTMSEVGQETHIRYENDSKHL